MEELWKRMRIYGTVKVGERGQVVIPSKARKDFNIKHGDLMLVVGGPHMPGIGLIKAETVKGFIERVRKSLGE